MLFSNLKTLNHSRFAVAAIGCASFIVLLAGCKEPPQIVEHRVPKAQSGLADLRNEKVDASPGSAKSAPSSFATPDGWTRGKSNPMFPSDKFLKTVDDNEVVMSIMSLPASNDWQSNVQRWAGQVGIETSNEQIKEMTTELEVDGISSSKVRLVSDDPDSEDSQAIVGIMAVKGDLAWFIKLMGKKAAVESAENDFDDYVTALTLP